VKVRILHHGRCFDGAVCAGLFAEFFSSKIDSGAEFAFVPKRHRTGDPYDPEDFGGDVHAVVDFRYSQHPRLDWYFDHHRSAFQLQGDREHFEADRSGKKFHDPKSPCCAEYMAGIFVDRFSHDVSKHDELIRWATMIDAARFPTPEIPVALEEPGMQLAAYIQSASDPAMLPGFISDLLNQPMARLVEADYVRKILEPRLETHRQDIALVRASARFDRGVLEYDLVSHGPRVLSHFIPYTQEPSARYVVGIYAHADGDLRLTVGYNPWLPPEEREHDLAALCELVGGGGHPQVAGSSFPLDQEDQLRAAQQTMLARLRKP
jgi:hypothetical protein